MYQWAITLNKIFSKTALFVRAFVVYVKTRPRYGILFFGAAIPFFLAIVIFLNVIWALTVPIPAFDRLQNRHVGESTKIYDRTGKVLFYDTAGSMQRTGVSFSAISPYLVNATIAIEDDLFYTHRGVRPAAVVRALVTNIESGSLRQGGSTITQQVVKNTFLTNDKSFIRKMREWVLALRLEHRYSKNEILEIYLNETPYGGVMYGVEEASQAYFSKPAKDLTLSEAAYLASLPKAPTYFSPWGSHHDELTKRHDLVLSRMKEQGMIRDDEYQNALTDKVNFAKRNTEKIRAPHFVFYVLEELTKKYGEEKVYGGGLQVKTTLDWDLQQESEQIIRNGALQNEKKFRASNAGLVAVDPRSGQILAMVGSRNYFDDSVDGQVNVALAHRQPGSTFKPFVYATAFGKGYTPETVLFDLKTQFSTACAPSNFSNIYPCYAPDNYNGDFKGPISLREALAQSINVVAVKTLYLSGIKESINTARSLGITTLADEKRYGLALVLGGGEVTLLEMTTAYGAFANDGVLHESTPILSVQSAEGDILYSYDKNNFKTVLDPEVARTINDILSDNVARTPAFGADSPLQFNDTLVADKTGTTNDYRDAWVIGYTPGIVVGAWAGNNDNTPMVKKVASYILAPIWHAAMEKAIAHSPSQAFQPPKKHIAASSTSLARAWDSEAGAHEILYWVNKDTPRAGPPANPYADPQLAQWEYPVLVWAGEQVPSTLAVGSLEDKMLLGTGGAERSSIQMDIVAPAQGANIPIHQPFTTTISHSEMENVLYVSYYLDGVYVDRSSVLPFSISIAAGKEGLTVLRAVAESPLGSSEASITLNIL